MLPGGLEMICPQIVKMKLFVIKETLEMNICLRYDV